MQICACLQTIDTGEIDGVFVEVLQHICEEEDWDNAQIDLPEHMLDLYWINFEVSGTLVQLVVVIQMF